MNFNKDLTLLGLYIYISILVNFISESAAQLVFTDEFREDELDCPTENDVFLSQPSILWGDPWRAYKTCPKELIIAPSTIPNAGYGVIALDFIKKYTWIGEYEGEVVPQERESDISWYAWHVHRGGIDTHFIDGFNIATSSYLRWVNCARNAKEENIITLECKGKVYYMTVKDIVPGQELFVYYGDEYAKELGIKLT